MTVRTETRTILASHDAAEAAARCLGEGGLVAFPTETVYGLGADATHAEAIGYKTRTQSLTIPLTVPAKGKTNIA